MDAQRFQRVTDLADSLRSSWKKARELEGESLESRPTALMRIEGAAGRLYWEADCEYRNFCADVF